MGQRSSGSLPCPFQKPYPDYLRRYRCTCADQGSVETRWPLSWRPVRRRHTFRAQVRMFTHSQFIGRIYVSVHQQNLPPTCRSRSRRRHLTSRLPDDRYVLVVFIPFHSLQSRFTIRICTDTRDISNLLSRAGFTLLTIDVDEVKVAYPSMW